MKKESCRAITNSAAFLLKIFLASAGRVAVTEGGDLGGLGVIPQQAFWPVQSGQNRKTCICLHCLPFSDTPENGAKKQRLLLANVFPATVSATVALRIEKLVYGYIEQCDELKKQVEAGVLAFVLDVHNGFVGLADQFRNIGLRPALCLSGLFQCQTEPMKVKPSFILVHSHITLYHCTFRVDL